MAAIPSSLRRLRVPREPWLVGLALLAASGLALGLADYAGVQGRGGVAEALRAFGATLLVFGVNGLGVVRLWLPEKLQRYELLWVLPTGACTTALGMTVLAYAKVPFDVNLVVVLACGVVTAAYAYRRDPRLPFGERHGRASLARQLIPLYVAMLIGAVMLTPMFRGGFATVIGNGSDAHLAVGTAQFLQNHAPREEATEEPVDRVPFVWNSKPPIYLAFGAVASVAGLPPYAVIATLAAALMAGAALGFWLLARHVLDATEWGAAAAMGLVGLDRMVVYTGMHPYFNQTWGFFAMPFAMVMCWLLTRQQTKGGFILAAIFLAVVATAYPLALPFPLVVAVTFYVQDRRRKQLPLIPKPRKPENKLAVAGTVVVGLLLIRVIIGILEKFETMLQVISPWESLRNWGGDQTEFLPERWFYGITDAGAFIPAAIALAFGAYWALKRAPRDTRIAFGILIVGTIAAALFFRPRDDGQYFHFKVLAFGAPIAVAVGAAGLSKVRRYAIGPLVLIALIGMFRSGTADEIGTTFDQLPQAFINLQKLDDRLPNDKSVRLDLQVDGRHFWIAYMLHGQRVCSQKPVLETQYPHEPVSRGADYILADQGWLRPFDADGPPVDRQGPYRLYRAKRGIGPDRCSHRMVQPVINIRGD